MIGFVAVAFGQAAPAPAPPPSQPGGIGAVLKIDPDARAAQVVSALPDTPAEAGGLRPGDLLVAADGESLRELPIDQVVARLRGPIGTPVRVSVLRDDAPLELALVRADTTAAVARSQKLAETVCPAWTRILGARGDLAAIQGPEVEPGWFESTVALPGATRTRIHRKLGARVVASFGAAPSASQAEAKLRMLVRDVAPCLGMMWFQDEPVDGRPQVLWGPEHRDGWFESIGEFRVTEANEVEWTMIGGARPTFYFRVVGDRGGEWKEPLARIVDAARRDWEGLGAAAIPGATACALTPRRALECTFPAGDPAVLFDELSSSVFGAVDPTWVYWYDAEDGPGGESTVHYARRARFGLEETVVVTVTPLPTGASVTIATDMMM